MTDRELLAVLARGATPTAIAQAGGELARRYQGYIFRACFRVLGNKHDALDACQEAFVRIVRACPRYRGDAAVATWIYRIAVNTARRSPFRAERHPRGELPGHEPADTTPQPDVLLRQLIDEAIGRLPAVLREAVVLCLVRELSRTEAAAQLGIPEGTLASRLAEAREQLRRWLSGRGVAVCAAALGGFLAREASAAVPALTRLRLEARLSAALASKSSRVGAAPLSGLTAMAAGLVVAVGCAIGVGLAADLRVRPPGSGGPFSEDQFSNSLSRFDPDAIAGSRSLAANHRDSAASAVKAHTTGWGVARVERGPLIVNFQAVEVVEGIWQLTGDVIDEAPGGLTVAFGGEPVSLRNVTATTDASGHFEETLLLNAGGSDAGIASAQVVNAHGRASNVALYNVWLDDSGPRTNRPLIPSGTPRRATARSGAPGS
jgi:RNA polymerase sigma factor (sigma-70 family)